jgi:hypothetical protein
MSHQEKRTITNLIAGALVLAVYCVHVWGKYQAGLLDPADLQAWAGQMLIFIGAGIAGTIIIQILYHIVFAVCIAAREGKCDDAGINKKIESSLVEDEMDKLIELKSLRVGFIMGGLGFLAGLVVLAAGGAPALMLNILFISFSAGSILEGFAKLYFYRRGVRNG